MARVDRLTVLSRRRESYSDFGINLERSVDGGDVLKYIDEAAVRNAIRAIVLTGPFERVYRPGLGSKVKSLLFDMLDEDLLKQTVISAVKNNEPRVENIDVTVEDRSDQNAAVLKIFFSVINIPQSFSLSIILKRVR